MGMKLKTRINLQTREYQIGHNTNTSFNAKIFFIYESSVGDKAVK